MEKLAIIGAGCLFPGADTPESFYQSLLDKKECISEQQPFAIGFDRFSVPLDIEKLDALGENFINMAYIIHETLRSSGYLQHADILARTGIIMGSRESFSEDEFNLFGEAYYSELEKNIRLLLDDERFSFSAAKQRMGDNSGFDPTAVFNFSYPTIYAAQIFALQGPAFAFDAACASSLYSIEMAAAYLNAGVVDMMVAGAVFFGLHETLPKFFDRLGVTAKPGESRPLDKNSGGMIPNEGGGAVVLKRLSDAERDGDDILAVIDAVGWSNSGRGKQVLAPSLRGQVYAYEDAYARLEGTGISPADIDYIECHATGTSVGDEVELNSLEAFYQAQLATRGNPEKPLFGALKGNIGHLLTGASIASLIKVIYSMKHNQIPATYAVTDPMSSEQGFFSGENMVIDNCPWPERAAGEQHLKRAAINGFGFGGSNAHLIVSEYRQGCHSLQSDAEIVQGLAPLSVVGLSAHMADLSGAKAVSDALYYGRTASKKHTTSRLKGIDQNAAVDRDFLAAEKLQNHLYFSSFEFDFLKNGVHPGEESEAVNKELLLLKLADEALEDAGFVKGEAHNIAVIIASKQSMFQLPMGLQAYMDEFIPRACRENGIELSAEKEKKLIKLTREALLSPRVGFDLIASCIGPIVANRISLVWNLIGPSMKLCCLENSMAQSVQLAQVLLQSRDLDAVLVGVIDSDPVLEGGIWHNKYGEPYHLSMDGLSHGEGAAAFVLKKTSQVDLQRDYVYANIEQSLIARYNQDTTAEAQVQALLEQAYDEAGVAIDTVNYLEIAGDPWREQVQPLLQAYNERLASERCHAGSAALNLGQSFMMSAGASLLKVLLMLSGAYQPKTLNNLRKTDAQWNYPQLELSAASQYWMNVGNRHYAAIGNAGFDNSFSHLLLSHPQPDSTKSLDSRKTFFRKSDVFLVLHAADVAGMQRELEHLLSQIEPHTVTAVLKQQLWLRYQHSAADARTLTAVLVAADLNAAQADAQTFLGVLQSGAVPDEWQSASGSYFTARPLAKDGKVCVCYPPSGLSTPSTVYELISSVPEVNQFLQQRIQQAHPEIKAVLTDLDRHQKSRQELPIFMDGLVGGLCSELLYQVIGVKPDAFVGLSFGELVMNSATDVYSEEEGADFIVDLVAPYIKRLSDPLFIRNYFSDYEFEWMTYFCTGDAARIERLLEWVDDQEEVFLTIHASPSTVIISGRRALCESGAKQVGCLAYPISENIFVHTPLAMHFYEEIIETNLQHPYEINAPKEATYYKTYDCDVFDFSKKDFAKNVADCICRPIHFKGVLEKAYSDGARLFIGLDGGDLCTGWIEENLGEREHVVAALKNRGMSFSESVHALAAKLIAHGVELDIGRICGFSPAEQENMESSLQQALERQAKSLVRTISNEPATFADAILTPQHIEYFRQVETGQTSIADTVVAAQASTPTSTQKETPSIANPAPQSVTTPPLNPVDTALPAMVTLAKEGSLQQRHQILLREMLVNNARMQEHYLQTQSHCHQLLMNQIAQGGDAVQLQLSSVSADISAMPHMATPPAAPYGYARTKPDKAVIWDRDTLEKLTLGSVSEQWGDAYRFVDDLDIRVRLPAPPFMFVSRVIDLSATFGELKPGHIEIEYDIPEDAWYLCRGYAPVSVGTESSHCGILLLSYMGVDVLFEGRLRFRAVDSSFTAFSDKLLCAGETCRGLFEITSIMQHKGAVLVFYTYNLYDAAGERLFQIKGMGGLFSEEELELVRQNKDVAKLLAKEIQKDVEKQHFDYPLVPEKKAFSSEDLAQIQQGRNDLCFDERYPASYEHHQMYPPNFQVLDRIVLFDLSAGDYGLGVVRGEADIDPGLWVFDAHFPNDPVLPATFIIEGAVQLIVFFFHAAGLVQNRPGSYHEPRLLQEQVSTFKFRDAVKRKATKVRYEAMIRSVAMEPQVVVTADVRIYNEDKLVAFVDNIAFKLIKPEVVQLPVQQAAN